MSGIRTAPCNYQAAGSTTTCGMDTDHRTDVLPAHLSVLQNQMRAISCTNVMTYKHFDEQQDQYRINPGSHDAVRLRNIGLGYFSNNNIHPQGANENPWSSEQHHMISTPFNTTEARLYHSLENLHWSAVADSRLHATNAPYRCMDSEFLFHWKDDSHGYEESTHKSHVQSVVQVQGNSPNVLKQTTVQQDNSHLAKVPQCHVSPAGDRKAGRDIKTELRERLRHPTFKAIDSSKVICCSGSLTNHAMKQGTENSTCRNCNKICLGNCSEAPVMTAAQAHSTPAIKQRLTSLYRLTSPEEIKQEAIRRLQLRRQNSSPNLNLRYEKFGKNVVKSRTTESLQESEIKGELSHRSELAADMKKFSKGRVYIPTFEEFKKMRNKGGALTNSYKKSGQNVKEQTSTDRHTVEGENRKEYQTLKNHLFTNEHFSNIESDNILEETDEQLHSNRSQFSPTHYCSNQNVYGSINCSNRDKPKDTTTTTTLQSAGQSTGFRQKEDTDGVSSPICTSPVPRSPLQVATTVCRGNDIISQQHSTMDKKYGKTFSFSEHSQTSEASSTCCHSLLLDTPDLSSYGATLQKMKDGIIGSALDLIKKRCSTDIPAESAAATSADAEKSDSAPEEGKPAPIISIAIESCSTETSTDSPTTAQPTECNASQNCRRSSLDAAYEAPDSVKAQRDCRLRPHFSDPMPTDAVKRKQLEMKIAAVARLQAQRRRQEKDTGPVLAKASTIEESISVLKPIENRTCSKYLQPTRQRWSKLSSLSADSGIVGLQDDREDKDDEEDSDRTMSSADVERVDSGIGTALAKNWKNRIPEVSTSLQVWEAHRPCTDCGERDFTSDFLAENRNKRKENLCEKCAKRRTERKEAILEFINTETSYGEDLKIIKEEFYVPMQSAGLLSPEQLAVVFSNVHELIDLNEKFSECLQEAIDQAYDQDDEDLLTVCIGEIFLEFVNMLPAFQTYCLQQSASINMLNSLEKEKELLRIFLDVSQNDNTVLRRMNLRSFLMAPLQRVTKYPLLLCRIIKATIEYHPDHTSLREAKSRVESHLEHINMKTKQESNTWSLRSFRRDSRRNREVINIEMREISIKTVGWSREDTRFVMEGSLQIAQPPDGQWIKKGTKALKFQNVHVLLMVNMKRLSDSCLDGLSAEISPHHEPIKDAVLTLIKDKSNGKFALLREPLKLCNCVISIDPECNETFELLEIRREAFVFRDSDMTRTHHWFRQIKRYSRELGSWKKRRNALPNIMISTTQSKS
ncbi:uncharacterized protein LOC122804862 [Protopterus annectens]|uniref:uncharacterized protein LOC122804862 n=1 Tax=Protopterus annectens TaxID=7888 RepID=UPI001CF9B268|nr:uncharacterized protein LOC122804862 [Protopterus annectens]XP_043930964.1 uncharacterized protein LOC122804862 [Protopterus annectens]XP_043930965.1 uncharacterized protein LOC122804862 [Protopterus annectens]